MRELVGWGALAVLIGLGGCASSRAQLSLASTGATMCKHCNCLMPAGIDPHTVCPVCNCRHQARECVRGR